MHNLVAGGQNRNAARPASASLRSIPAEQDSDDDVPTLRRIPIGRVEPSPSTQGGIVFDPSDGKHHAFAPGPNFLGSYSTHAQAQHRIDLFFGRPSLARTGVRKRPHDGGEG